MEIDLSGDSGNWIILFRTSFCLYVLPVSAILSIRSISSKGLAKSHTCDISRTLIPQVQGEKVHVPRGLHLNFIQTQIYGNEANYTKEQ